MEPLREQHTEISAQMIFYFACQSGTKFSLKSTEKNTTAQVQKPLPGLNVFFLSKFSLFCDQTKEIPTIIDRQRFEIHSVKISFAQTL